MIYHDCTYLGSHIVLLLQLPPLLLVYTSKNDMLKYIYIYIYIYTPNRKHTIYGPKGGHLHLICVELSTDSWYSRLSALNFEFETIDANRTVFIT